MACAREKTQRGNEAI